MLVYVNRIMDILDGMVDLKRREVGGDLYDTEVDDLDKYTIEGLRDGLPPEVRLRLNLRRHMTLQAVIDDALYVDKIMERDNRKHGRNLDRPNTGAGPQQNQGKRTAVAEQGRTSS